MMAFNTWIYSHYDHTYNEAVGNCDRCNNLLYKSDYPNHVKVCRGKDGNEKTESRREQTEGNKENSTATQSSGQTTTKNADPCRRRNSEATGHCAGCRCFKDSEKTEQSET